MFRCELLMRSAERELLEIEKKRLPAESGNLVLSSTKSVQDSMKRRMIDIAKSIGDESKKLALVRAQIQKLKATHQSNDNGEKDNEQKAQDKKAVQRNTNVSVPEALYSTLCRYCSSFLFELFLNPSFTCRLFSIKDY